MLGSARAAGLALMNAPAHNERARTSSIIATFDLSPDLASQRAFLFEMFEGTAT